MIDACYTLHNTSQEDIIAGYKQSILLDFSVLDNILYSEYANGAYGAMEL